MKPIETVDIPTPLIFRAVGESHNSSHALGYSVIKVRLMGIVFGGCMCVIFWCNTLILLRQMENINYKDKT